MNRQIEIDLQPVKPVNIPNISPDEQQAFLQGQQTNMYKIPLKTREIYTVNIDKVPQQIREIKTQEFGILKNLMLTMKFFNYPKPYLMDRKKFLKQLLFTPIFQKRSSFDKVPELNDDPKNQILFLFGFESENYVRNACSLKRLEFYKLLMDQTTDTCRHYDSLSNKMLCDILEYGVFCVQVQRGKKEIWKLAPCFVYSAYRRRKILIRSFEVVYNNFFFIPHRFIQPNKKNCYHNCFKHPQIYHGIINIIQFPIVLFAVFFGISGWYMQKDIAPTQDVINECLRQIEVKRQNQIKNRIRIREEDIAVLNYLYQDIIKKVQANQQLANPPQNNYIPTIPQELDLSQNFQMDGFQNVNIDSNAGHLKQAFMIIEDKLFQARINAEQKFNKQNPTFHQEVQAELYQIQDQLIDQSDLPQQVKTNIKNYIRALHIIKKNYFKKTLFLNESLDKLPAQIHASSCLSRIERWFRHELHYQTKRLYREAKRNCFNQIKNELQQNNLNHLFQIYQHYSENYEDVQIPQSLKKQVQNQMYQQYTSFFGQPLVDSSESREYLWPSVAGRPGEYYLKRTTTYKIQSHCPFWKQYAFFVRWWCYSCNIMHYCFEQAFYGPCGIQTLFCPFGYYGDRELDPITGRYIQNDQQNKQQSICQNFKQLWIQIKENRQNFESIPNRGILGKGITRFIDYIKNYVWLFLIQGVFLQLILWPLAILIISLVFFIIGISGIVWALIAVIFQQLFIWFLYDFDTKNGSKWKPLRVPSAAPFFLALGNLLILGIFQIVWALIMILFHCIVIVIYQVLGFLKFFFRTALDYFDFFFLYCCGRVPMYSGCIAWKTITSQDVNKKQKNKNNYSSSSSSKYDRQLRERAAAAVAVYDELALNSEQMYYTMRPSEVYLFFRANLELYQLKQMQNIIEKNLYPQEFKDQLTRANHVFQALGVTYENKYNELLNKKVELIKQTLKKQTDNQKKLYPELKHIGCVKFNQQQIAEMFPATQKIIQNFVTNNNLFSIWEWCNINQDNWQMLTKILWQQFFQDKNILRPIEEIDKRFDLKQLIEEEKKEEEKVDQIPNENEEDIQQQQQPQSVADNVLNFLNKNLHIDKKNDIKNKAKQQEQPKKPIQPLVNYLPVPNFISLTYLMNFLQTAVQPITMGFNIDEEKSIFINLRVYKGNNQ